MSIPAARRAPARLAALPDAALLDVVQRQTCRYFWVGAHPGSGLAYDRRTAGRRARAADPVAVGGSGFGAMALIVAVERGWIERAAALERFGRMLDLLGRARRYHGAFPHFLDGRTGATIPFSAQDDAADVVETSLLIMGLLCVRQYFSHDTPAENAVRERISTLWNEVEWSWFTRGGQDVLYWHWSPVHGWAMNHAIRGWNECLVTYVLAASSPRHAIEPSVYHRGFASGPGFLNGKRWHGIELPLGVAYGGPLFFTHYSFCGLDPHGLTDRYADYWEQNVRHVRINRAHCIANPGRFKGYGEDCWGLTASDDPAGYAAHAPDNDNGTISPTGALASLPYAPGEALAALRHFLLHHGERLWRGFGFVDAFCESRNWYADTFLAIDQGPIIAMIENQRTGLLWRLFMAIPEVQGGLRRLGFASPHLRAAGR
ncbi:MAG TPA: glucoamylase family protein [Gammaproteobacteria bacterium]|nr:glucoamylase family protein [Gammaproteobacteria bacterium]